MHAEDGGYSPDGGIFGDSRLRPPVTRPEFRRTREHQPPVPGATEDADSRTRKAEGNGSRHEYVAEPLARGDGGGPPGADEGVRSRRTAATDRAPATSGTAAGGTVRGAGRLAVPDSKLLTDSEGFTLYRFDRDTAEPPRANCAGGCPKKWPAVPPMERNGVDGVTTKGFVTFDRPDGVEKQSLDCWPLCAFSGDTRPGYANGQGAGGTWYAVSSDARLVGAPGQCPEDPPWCRSVAECAHAATGCRTCLRCVTNNGSLIPVSTRSPGGRSVASGQH
ncbi:hypothetical protein AB0P41_24535 [Streptomyces sp. NPDC079167]|uniref:hypothetical protein n=1 Tax=Streptomyces sp. NPDC079167 TaxID=3154513 RepID=UPI0034289B84